MVCGSGARHDYRYRCSADWDALLVVALPAVVPEPVTLGARNAVVHAALAVPHDELHAALPAEFHAVLPAVVPSAALLVVIHAVLLQPDVVWPRVVLFLCGAASNLAA